MLLDLASVITGGLIATFAIIVAWVIWILNPKSLSVRNSRCPFVFDATCDQKCDTWDQCNRWLNEDF